RLPPLSAVRRRCAAGLLPLNAHTFCMKSLTAIALVVFCLAVPLGAHAADDTSPAHQLMTKLQWRSIGPYIGGRVVAVAGVPTNPDLFYMGGVQGGVWRSTNYGLSW